MFCGVRQPTTVQYRSTDARIRLPVFRHFRDFSYICSTSYVSVLYTRGAPYVMRMRLVLGAGGTVRRSRLHLTEEIFVSAAKLGNDGENYLRSGRISVAPKTQSRQTSTVADGQVRSTCRGETVESGVLDKVPKQSTLISGDTQISLQHSVGWAGGSLRAKNPARFVQSFRYNTGL